MRETKAERSARFYRCMTELGFSYDEASTLRRIEMTLQRWGELECGDSNGWSIERDEDSTAICTQCSQKWYGETAETGNCPKCGDCAPIRQKATGKPYLVLHRHHDGKEYRRPCADRERGALKRLTKIMASHPDLWSYHQSDPRGCALYVGRKSEMNGDDINCCYTRGVAVCI